MSSAPSEQDRMGILKNLADQARDLGRAGASSKFKKTVRQLRQDREINLAALVQAIENEKINMKNRKQKKTAAKAQNRKCNNGHQSTTKPKSTRKKRQPYKTLSQRKQALAQAMKKGCVRAGATSAWRLDNVLWDSLGAYRAYLTKMTVEQFEALLRRQNADGTFMMDKRLEQLGFMIWKATGMTVPKAVCDEAVARMRRGDGAQASK